MICGSGFRNVISCAEVRKARGGKLDLASTLGTAPTLKQSDNMYNAILYIYVYIYNPDYGP